MIDHTGLRSDVLPGDAIVTAENLERYEIELLLAAIQVELDEIGMTFGMQQRRVALKQRKDELLDRLLELVVRQRDDRAHARIAPRSLPAAAADAGGRTSAARG